MITSDYSLYHLPAEWYEQDATQLTWPHEDTDWQPYLDDIKSVCLNLAKAIVQCEQLIVATPQPEITRKELATRLTQEELCRVQIIATPTNDTWARDHAGITLLPLEGDGEPRMLDFCFNGWGEKFASDKDNRITRNLHAAGIFNGTLVDNNDFVLEGGSIESDGKGTLFTTSCCLLAPHRNQPLDEAQIADELKRRIGARRIVFIHHGELMGDDTDGHIDTLVRTAPNDTLVYVGCQRTDDEHYAELKAMEDELKTLRTEDGKPYRLIALPLPEPIFDEGERLPATYANFVVLNGTVVVPTYNQPALDAEAREKVGQAFPDFKVVGIDARTVIRQHGSLHCMTMQYPKGTMRLKSKS